MDEVMGTTFLEHGTWLLRHEGGDGNKVPLLGPADLLSKLKDGEAKIFVGEYSRDHRGAVVAAHVTAIKIFDRGFDG